MTIDEVRALALTLPRSREAFVRGRIKFSGRDARSGRGRLGAMCAEVRRRGVRRLARAPLSFASTAELHDIVALT
jgi:hypothetical protein